MSNHTISTTQAKHNHAKHNQKKHNQKKQSLMNQKRINQDAASSASKTHQAQWNKTIYADAENRARTYCRLTEIILPTHNGLPVGIILPMIAYLSQEPDRRWLTWVSPPKALSKTTLENFRVDTAKLRFIYPQTDGDKELLFTEALKEGNSNSVILNSTKLPETELAKFERAANLGNCEAIVLRGH